MDSLEPELWTLVALRLGFPWPMVEAMHSQLSGEDLARGSNLNSLPHVEGVNPRLSLIHPPAAPKQPLCSSGDRNVQHQERRLRALAIYSAELGELQKSSTAPPPTAAAAAAATSAAATPAAATSAGGTEKVGAKRGR